MTNELEKSPHDEESLSILDLIHKPIVDWDRVREVLASRVLMVKSSNKSSANHVVDEFRLEHHEALIAALARPSPIVPPDVSRTLLRLLTPQSYDAAVHAVLFNENQSVEVCRQVLLYRYPKSAHGGIRPVFTLLVMDGGHLNMVQAMIERWPRLMYDYEHVASLPLWMAAMAPLAQVENPHQHWNRRVRFMLKMWHDHCLMTMSSAISAAHHHLYPLGGILEIGEDGCCPLERMCSGNNTRDFYIFVRDNTPHLLHHQTFATILMRHVAISSEIEFLHEIVSINPTALASSSESHSALKMYCAHFCNRIMHGQYPNPTILQIFMSKGDESHFFLDQEMGGLVCTRYGEEQCTALRYILNKLLRDDTLDDDRSQCLEFIINEVGMHRILKEGFTIQSIDAEHQQHRDYNVQNYLYSGTSLLDSGSLKGWRDIISRGMGQVEQFNIHQAMDVIAHLNDHYGVNERVCEKMYKTLFSEQVDSPIEKHKDGDGRMLLHHILSSMATSEEKLGRCRAQGILKLVINGNVNALAEVDPTTGLLPFTQAALIQRKGVDNDDPIALSFELLQLHPDVLEQLCLKV